MLLIVVIFLILIYGTGILIYSLLATFILNKISKRGQIRFSKTFSYCTIGAVLGTVISFVIFQIYKTEDVVFGQPKYRENLRRQIEFVRLCVLLPIGTILTLSIISFRIQMRKEKLA